MGLSGKSASSQSTSTSGSAQPWANPYAQQAAGQVQNVFSQNQPGLQALTELTRNSVVNPLLSKFNSSLGTANQARDYYSGVLNSKGGNPYLDSVLNQTNRDVTNNVNSQFELSGRYGSDAHGYGLARGMSDSENALRYQGYQDDQAHRDAAAQALTAGNSQDIAQLLAALGAGAEMPYAGSSNLANSLGALFNGGSSQSTSTGAKPGIFDYLAQAASNAASAASASSDIRLKTNVTKVGQFPDGLGVYTFAYKTDPKQMFKGVMAHEVKELRPWAYVENYRDGYAGVNYGAL